MVLLTSPGEPDPLCKSPTLASLANTHMRLIILGANTQGTIWTSVETSIGVVCVNLPTMSPLFRRFILRRDVTAARANPSNSYPSSAKKPPINTISNRIASTSSTEALGTSASADQFHQDIVVTTDYTVTDQEDGAELDDLTRPVPGGATYQGTSRAWHQTEPVPLRPGSRG